MCLPDFGRSCKPPSPPPLLPPPPPPPSPPPPPYCEVCTDIPPPCSTACGGCLSPLVQGQPECQALASTCFPTCDQYIMCELCPSMPEADRLFCESTCTECEPFVPGVQCGPGGSQCTSRCSVYVMCNPDFGVSCKPPS